MTLRELLALSDEELHALTPEDILGISGISDRRRRPPTHESPAEPRRRHLRLVRTGDSADRN
jgi:hypothetical protein